MLLLRTLVVCSFLSAWSDELKRFSKDWEQILMSASKS